MKPKAEIIIDEMLEFKDRMHADKLWVLDNGGIIVIEETERVKVKDIEQLRASINDRNLIENVVKQRVGFSNCKLIAAMLHFTRKLGLPETEELKRLVSFGSKQNVKVGKANCQNELESFVRKVKNKNP
ncbi:MAG: hypothetical protein NZ570_01545 [Candidatus Caldarchaeum sp.]|nr:hypothetical protein [Candidatus Caldarchaeum sp.]MCS7138171.1 hypothetical protein [Candidatus Caldarchaeum sp.]MDW8360457.1 hypothetical protein [Candidatus Caldarchaeum sp.]